MKHSEAVEKGARRVPRAGGSPVRVRHWLASSQWHPGWQFALALCLVAGVMLSLPGCGGCRKKPPTSQEEKKKQEEEKKKKEQEKKPPFEIGRLLACPADQLSGDAGQLAGTLYKPGHWTAASVAAKTNHFDFLGELELATTERGGKPLPLLATPYYLATTREIALPKGQPKLFESLFYAPTSRQQATVSLRVNNRGGGRRMFESPFEVLRRMPSYQYHLVVLARWPTRYGYLNKLATVKPPTDEFLGGVEPVGSYYRVDLMKPGRRMLLPSHAMLWTSTACVVWDDLEPSFLSVEQQQALVDWLHWGGQLIVSGPDTLDTLRDSFLTPYLAATSNGTAAFDANSFDALQQWSDASKAKPGRQLVPTKPLSGVELKLHPQAQFIPGSGDLFAERYVGRGRVVVSAISLSGNELTNWPCFDEAFNAMLLRRPQREFFGDPDGKLKDLQVEWVDGSARRLDAARICQLRYLSRDTGVTFAEYGADVRAQDVTFDLSEMPPAGTGVAAWRDFNPVANTARATLQEAARIEIPNRDFVVWIVAAYLIVLVPANWIIFRTINRVEWAWAAAPIISVVCTGVVIRMAQLDIGFARSQTEVGILELQGNYARGHLTRYNALYTSLTTSYRFQFDEPGGLVQPFPEVASPDDYRETSRRSLLYHNAKHPHLNGFSVDSNTVGMVHSEEMVNLGGGLTLKEVSDRVVEVSNRSVLTLHDALVTQRGDGEILDAWIGELAPGATVRLTLEPRDSLRQTLPSSGEANRSRLFSSQPQPGELNLAPLAQLVMAADELPPGETRLVAWTDQPLPGLEIYPAAPQSKHASLVVAHLRLVAESLPEPDKNTPETPKYRSSHEGFEEYGKAESGERKAEGGKLKAES